MEDVIRNALYVFENSHVKAFCIKTSGICKNGVCAVKIIHLGSVIFDCFQRRTIRKRKISYSYDLVSNINTTEDIASGKCVISYIYACGFVGILNL